VCQPELHKLLLTALSTALLKTLWKRLPRVTSLTLTRWMLHVAHNQRAGVSSGKIGSLREPGCRVRVDLEAG
jgi:hypothetical protein